MSLVLGPQPRVKPEFGPFIVKELRAYVIGDKGERAGRVGGVNALGRASARIRRAGAPRPACTRTLVCWGRADHGAMRSLGLRLAGRARPRGSPRVTSAGGAA
jgi:hypothetical protein